PVVRRRRRAPARALDDDDVPGSVAVVAVEGDVDRSVRMDGGARFRAIRGVARIERDRTEPGRRSGGRGIPRLIDRGVAGRAVVADEHLVLAAGGRRLDEGLVARPGG